MLADLRQWLQLAEGPEFTLALVALGVAAAAGLYGFLRYSRLLRLVADTPTARIRSAAQGFVQLEGAAGWLPGPEIRAPLTGHRCVWYRYRVEENRGQGSKRRRVVIDRGQSDDLFLLRDETGECVVDPDGATVIAPERDVWTASNRLTDFGPGPGSGWLRAGRYRYVEERLSDRQALLVLGEFTTRQHQGQDRAERMRDLLGRWKNDPDIIARFDSDGDGRLSLQDWEAVRAHAHAEVERELANEVEPDAFHLLRRGTHGTQRVLVLSTLGESQLLFRQRLRAYGSGLTFALATSLTIWAWTIR
ncbi:hypothetical protein TVNIR_3818 [Thioalkalivibrio nitratireducens DSM 14787]|uniref:RING-type E3 ubiquitin transferase n=1 Tax=Thioalkalivibrio nitratireducens (strain DSM 14787 / UNIQEM 213 / ALEN2) TaxID=1255043 RepID=L0E2H2_THIND|nr:hypothetical protein [Thioalkalivibrio nitratireducens]AGA35442.1 hypothetical protein TVNIR_3818 [Thioalkalivibrio nitratireducens DSM 14787]